MNFKFLRLLGVMFAFALVAAACGSDDDSSSGSSSDSSSATEEHHDSLGDGSLGVVTVEAGEDIQIRSLNAITGDVAFLGIPNQRGVEQALADFGDIHGFSVTIGTGLDDLCSADGGQAAAQTIVADEQVVGVIGTSCSGAATAASPLISEAGMVMISPSNTSPALTSDLAGTAGENYHPGYYRTAHNDLYQGAAAAGFAIEVLGVTSAAAIHDGDPYTQGLAQAFADAFEGHGGTITTFTAVNKGDTDMVPVLTEVAAGSPEMLFFPIFQPEGDFIVQQASQVAGLENTTMMAADGLLNSNFMSIPESEGLYFSGPDIRYGTNYNQTESNSVNVSSTDGTSWGWNTVEGKTQSTYETEVNEAYGEVSAGVTTEVGAEGSVPGFAKVSGKVGTSVGTSVGGKKAFWENQTVGSSSSSGNHMDSSASETKGFGSTTTDSAGTSFSGTYALSSQKSLSQTDSKTESQSNSTTYSMGGSGSLSENFTQGSQESWSETWQESSTDTSLFSMSGVVPNGKCAAVWRQTVRHVRVGHLYNYDLCGVRSLVGELYFNEWSWSPNIAIGDDCNVEVPPSTLPAWALPSPSARISAAPSISTARWKPRSTGWRRRG